MPEAISDTSTSFHASRLFTGWLHEQNASLAFSTYQAGKLFLIGPQSNGRLSIFERTFNRCMGLWSDGQTMWMTTLYQIWRFENLLLPGETSDGYDRIYVPQLAYTTGDLDIHDIGMFFISLSLYFLSFVEPSVT